MITQTYQIDMTPSGAPVIVHVSQYDVEARTLVFELFNGGIAYTPSGGAVVAIRGTKPDETVFMYNMTVSGATASIDIQQQMALVAGDVPCEIRVTDTDGTVNSANFILRVEKGAVDESTAISDTDIPLFTQLVDEAEAAAHDAQVAQAAVEALIPAGGTDGQFLQTENGGTQWADVHQIPQGGAAGDVLTKQSATDYDTDWETPAYVPAGGSVGDLLTKTSTGYTWATISGGGGDVAVEFTYANGTWSADKTFLQVVACINNDGTPYGVYGNGIYRMAVADTSASITFSQTQGGGFIQNFVLRSDDTVSYTVSQAYSENTVTLLASLWSGNVYTLNSIAITQYCKITLTIPDQTTQAQMETAIAEYEAYDLYAFNQRTGAIDIYARGTVPTSNITLTMVVERRQ